MVEDDGRLAVPGPLTSWRMQPARRPSGSSLTLFWIVAVGRPLMPPELDTAEKVP